MFLIPTQLGMSSIHGMGVFACQDIPAGTLIWKYEPRVDWTMTPEQLTSFPEPFRQQLRDWCYIDEAGQHILCGDSAKFMNHSDHPNCDDTGDLYTIAKCDIRSGDELTCDYRTFDQESAASRGILYGN